VDYLIASEHEVVIVDDLSTGRRTNINPAATFYEIDIRSPDMHAVFEKERPDIVDHHAAQMSVNVSVSHPLLDADINILGTLNLLELCKEFDVKKFVYISSGGTVYGEPEYLPCDEAHPIRPLSPYGVSKYTIERYLYMYYHTYGLDYAALRYANVYGPRQDPKGEAGVVAIFTGQMLQGQPVTIFGDGDQERDFVYVEDIARANLLAMMRGNPRAYNIGSGRGTSVNQIYEALKAITNYDKDARRAPAKPGEVYKTYLTNGLAGEELGWEPQIDLTAGLEQTVAYFREVELNEK
jgi:UDP-glucose 4-epimerase